MVATCHALTYVEIFIFHLCVLPTRGSSLRVFALDSSRLPISCFPFFYYHILCIAHINCVYLAYRTGACLPPLHNGATLLHTVLDCLPREMPVVQTKVFGIMAQALMHDQTLVVRSIEYWDTYGRAVFEVLQY